jgi:hypothetical protein
MYIFVIICYYKTFAFHHRHHQFSWYGLDPINHVVQIFVSASRRVRLKLIQLALESLRSKLGVIFAFQKWKKQIQKNKKKLDSVLTNREEGENFKPYYSFVAFSSKKLNANKRTDGRKLQNMIYKLVHSDYRLYPQVLVREIDSGQPSSLPWNKVLLNATCMYQSSQIRV